MHLTSDLNSRERASQPVGTTVRASELFKSLPVRKQAALKASAKCLGKIKSTLQAYAMARPSVRFSLKVLKAKNDKGNWMYAPKPDASVEDAAFKIVGNACASQCHYTLVEENGITVQSLLPKSDADPAKVSGGGHFLSVDFRPVSAGRGFLKQVLDAFRAKIKAFDECFTDIKDPFIWLNISCPPGAYDVNVEPAKDDVVFEDNEKIMEVIKKLLDACYPTPDPASPPQSRPSSRRKQAFEIHEDAEEQNDERPLSKRRRLHELDMLDAADDFDDDISLISEGTRAQQEQTSEVGEDVEDSSPSKGLNPFVIAKLNARTSPHKQPPPGRKPSQPLRELPDTAVNAQEETSGLPPYPPWALLTPGNSSPARPQRQRSPPDRRTELGFTLPPQPPPFHAAKVCGEESSAASQQNLRDEQREESSPPQRPNDFTPAHEVLLGPSSASSPAPTVVSDNAPTNARSRPVRPPLPLNPFLEGVRPLLRARRSENSLPASQEPSGSYCDPLGMMPTPPSPTRKKPPAKRNRSIQDMLVGRGIDKPFKPPRRQARHEQDSSAHPPPMLFSQGNPRRAPPTRKKNLHPDFETPSQAMSEPDITAEFTSVTPPPRVWMGPSFDTEGFPDLGERAQDAVEARREAQSLLLERPLHDLQRLIKPLHLSISALTLLVNRLQSLHCEQSNNNGAFSLQSLDSSHSESVQGCDEPQQSSLVTPPPTEDEVENWREMILRWLAEREGEDFVEALLEEEEREEMDLVDVWGGVSNPGILNGDE